MAKIIDLGGKAYGGFASLLSLAQNPLLLAIRLYWGWQFMQDGWGKLTHLDKVTQFFASLNLPAPALAALMVASVSAGPSPNTIETAMQPTTAEIVASTQIARCGVRFSECSMPKCPGTSSSFPIA